MGALARARAALMGRPESMPARLVRRHPELMGMRLRRGGLPPRVGGWVLGRSTVSAITLWRTVFLAPGTPLAEELLLHESRHVQQFQTNATFPIRYVWESLRRGYHGNRYEADARAYAAMRVRGPHADLRRDEV
jgi:hypothetical protein